MRKYVTLFIASMVIFVSMGSGFSFAKDIVVLTQFPMSGPLGSMPELGWGYIDAMNWFNNETGGLGGKKVKWHLEDMRYSPPVEIANFNRFAAKYNSDEFLLATGYVTGALKPLIKKVNEEEKIPWIDGSFSTEIFGPEGGPSKYPYYYSLGATYADQIKILIKWIAENHKGDGAPKVAFVNSPTAFGRDGIQEGLAYAKQKGLNVVAQIEYPYSATDATNENARIRKSKANYVIYHGYTGFQNASAIFVKAFRKINPKVKLLGSHYIGGVVPFMLTGDAYDGVIIGSCWPPFDAIPRSSTPMDNAMVKMIHDFAKKYRPEEYKKGMRGGIRDMLIYFIGAMYAFVGQQGLLEAYEDGDLSRSGIKKAMDSMVWDFKGMFDGKTFAYKSHTIPMLRLYQAKVKMVEMGGKKVPTGRWVPISDWINTSELNW